VVEIRPGDAGNVAPFLDRHNALRAARLGRLENSLDHPSFVAVRDGRVVGVATYVIDGDSCELLTLHVDDRFRGIGTALVDAVVAAAEGCSRLWLITTNDNVDALRFYQRRGFTLVALHRGAVDDSRARLKPEIAEIGDHGIPLRDELELERVLDQPRG
jgi:ribosomal protein S18 acetylase RimI-like enzyme